MLSIHRWVLEFRGLNLITDKSRVFFAHMASYGNDLRAFLEFRNDKHHMAAAAIGRFQWPLSRLLVPPCCWETVSASTTNIETLVCQKLLSRGYTTKRVQNFLAHSILESYTKSLL